MTNELEFEIDYDLGVLLDRSYQGDIHVNGFGVMGSDLNKSIEESKQKDTNDLIYVPLIDSRIIKQR